MFVIEAVRLMVNSQMDAIYSAVEKKNPGKNVLKRYPDSPHGFLAARADVSDSSPRSCRTAKTGHD
jgi:hypothetical protein